MKDAIKRIFDSNSKLDEVFETSDGNAFYLEGDAKNHARTLKNPTVTKHIRPEADEAPATEVTEETPEADDAPATEVTEETPETDDAPATEVTEEKKTDAKTKKANK